jgi:quinol monooxygenase YgiN
MPYIRVSIARPRPGQERRLEEVMGKIVDFVGRQEGCQRSYLLKPHDDSGDIARIAIYDDEAAATRAANLDHMMSLRSEFNLAAQEGHMERGFFDIPHTPAS